MPAIDPNQIHTFENHLQLFLALTIVPGWWIMKFKTWKKYNINSHIIKNVPKIEIRPIISNNSIIAGSKNGKKRRKKKNYLNNS